MQRWQREFIAEIRELSNKELYDEFVARLIGYDRACTDERVHRWETKKVEEELDYRLRNWFIEDEADEFEDIIWLED